MQKRSIFPKAHLSTYYKSKTGANLSDRIQFFRIQKAVELLADPKLRIGDIGALVGINNVNTFLRQFEKIHRYDAKGIQAP